MQPGRANQQNAKQGLHERAPRKAGRGGGQPAARGAQGGALVGQNGEVTDGSAQIGGGEVRTCEGEGGSKQ